MALNDINMDEANIIFTWTSCCRLCLTPNAKIYLHESDIVFEDLSTKIRSNLNFLIYRGDPMPKKICGECLLQLDAWNTFRIKCANTVTQLKAELLKFNCLNFVQEFLQKDQTMQCSSKSIELGAENSVHLKNKSSSPSEASQEYARDILEEIIDKIENSEIGRSTTEQTTIKKNVTWEPVFTVKPDNLLEKPHIKMEICDFNPDIVKPESSEHLNWDAGNVSDVSETSEIFSDDKKRYDLRPRSNLKRYADCPDDDEACSQITPWKCDACRVHFSTRFGLTLHQTSKKCCGSSMQRFRCLLCRKRFYSLEDYAEHNIHHISIAIHSTADDLFCCKKCDAKFADQVRFDDHVKRHSDNLQSLGNYYVVENVVTASQLSPMIVENDQPEVKSPAPAFPTLALPIATSPLLEMKQPSVQNQYLGCSLCLSRFLNEDLLYDHRFAAHGIPDERVACTTCALKFRSQNLLNKHLNSHCVNAVDQNGAVAGSARCRQCGRLFASQEELVKHEAVKHIPLSCRKCQRPFPTRSALLLHYRTHNTTPQPVIRSNHLNPKSNDTNEEVENPKTCRYCSVEFKYKSDYDVHYASHIKFKKNNFECDISQNSVIHFQCSECPQLFPVMIDATKHSRDKHNGKECKLLPLKCPAQRIITNTFLCTVCNLDFPTSPALSFHANKKHGINEPLKPSVAAVSQYDAVPKPAPASNFNMPVAAAKQTRELWQEEANKIIRDINGVQCCTLCHIKLGKVEEEKRHREVHNRDNLYVVQVDETLFQCTVCNHVDDKRDAALRHIEVHANLDFKPQLLALSCPFCASRFSNATSVEDHIVDKHAAGE